MSATQKKLNFIIIPMKVIHKRFGWIHLSISQVIKFFNGCCSILCQAQIVHYIWNVFKYLIFFRDKILLKQNFNFNEFALPYCSCSRSASHFLLMVIQFLHFWLTSVFLVWSLNLSRPSLRHGIHVSTHGLAAIPLTKCSPYTQSLFGIFSVMSFQLISAIHSLYLLQLTAQSALRDI